MVALACGTRINFQRGDSRAKLRRVWANPVRGGARVDEDSADAPPLDTIQPAIDLARRDCTLFFVKGSCGHVDGTQATMGIAVESNRHPKNRSLRIIVSAFFFVPH
jgi:hypothetical protein